MILSRRNFFTGLAAVVAAPAIITSAGYRPGLWVKLPLAIADFDRAGPVPVDNFYAQIGNEVFLVTGGSADGHTVTIHRAKKAPGYLPPGGKLFTHVDFATQNLNVGDEIKFTVRTHLE